MVIYGNTEAAIQEQPKQTAKKTVDDEDPQPVAQDTLDDMLEGVGMPKKEHDDHEPARMYAGHTEPKDSYAGSNSFVLYQGTDHEEDHDSMYH